MMSAAHLPTDPQAHYRAALPLPSVAYCAPPPPYPGLAAAVGDQHSVRPFSSPWLSQQPPRAPSYHSDLLVAPYPQSGGYVASPHEQPAYDLEWNARTGSGDYGSDPCGNQERLGWCSQRTLAHEPTPIPLSVTSIEVVVSPNCPYQSPLLGGSESDCELTARQLGHRVHQHSWSPHQFEASSSDSPSSSPQFIPVTHPGGLPPSLLLATYQPYYTAPTPLQPPHSLPYHHYHQQQDQDCSGQELTSAALTPSFDLARRRGRKRRSDDIMVPHPSTLVAVKDEKDEEASEYICATDMPQWLDKADSLVHYEMFRESTSAEPTSAYVHPVSTTRPVKVEHDVCMHQVEFGSAIDDEGRDDFSSDEGDNKCESDGNHASVRRSSTRKKGNEDGKRKRQITKVERKVTKVPVTDSINIEAHLSPESDGYRWRKYGRKTVKGSPFPRSYFKCTYPHCIVKKQVEAVIKDGHITSTCSIYKGTHNHDRPCVTQLSASDQDSFRSVVIAEFAKHGQGIASSSSTSGTPRLVVTTEVSVDYLDDGYRWRKYGQKYVKGSGFPRSYYKCTDKTCPVKKQVDSLVDGHGMIVTYEGAHTHEPWLDRSSPCKRRRGILSTGSGSAAHSPHEGSSQTEEETNEEVCYKAPFVCYQIESEESLERVASSCGLSPSACRLPGPVKAEAMASTEPPTGPTNIRTSLSANGNDANLEEDLSTMLMKEFIKKEKSDDSYSVHPSHAWAAQGIPFPVATGNPRHGECFAWGSSAVPGEPGHSLSLPAGAGTSGESSCLSTASFSAFLLPA